MATQPQINLSQVEPTLYTSSQASANTLPTNPSRSVENGNDSPTSIILGIAMLLLVLRPVMLQQKPPSSNK